MNSDRGSAVAAILAGGQGRRMGGRDKGLIDWRGRPLVAHVLLRLAPQGLPVVINANRNPAAYARFGHRVIPDRIAHQAGPLAGMLSVMQAVGADQYLFVPCDAPLLPSDLHDRLRQALDSAPVMAACARDAERIHPTFVLLSGAARQPLTDYLAAGGRRVRDFLESVGLVTVAWPDGQRVFRNINYPADLDPTEPASLPIAFRTGP